MSEHSKIVVVNIVAVSYSGSTWANMLFGANSQAFSVGELDAMKRAGKAVCAIHRSECPVWSRFEVASVENPFVQISRITGKRFLIVNNSTQFLQCQRDPRIDSRFVWIVRDGRAVVASTLRRYTHRSTDKACRDWVRAIRKKRRIIDSQPRGKTIRILYEMFLADVPAHLERLTEFLGMEYEPAMLDYLNQDLHFIGGNTGAMTLYADSQGLSKLYSQRKTGDVYVVDLSGSTTRNPRGGVIDLKHYRNNNPKQFSDERWKSQLTNRQLRVFALMAGRLNRGFGYPPSLDRQSAARHGLSNTTLLDSLR